MHHELMTQEVPNENQVRQGLTNVHLGRGGAGNVRSPSRDPQEQYLHEQEKLRALEEQDDMQAQELVSQVYATGRGGAGNIPAQAPVADPPHERGRQLHETTRPERVSSPRNVASIFRPSSRSRSRELRTSAGRDSSLSRVAKFDRIREEHA